MTKDENSVIDRAMMAVFGDAGVPVGDAAREESGAKALLRDAGGLVRI